MQLLEQEIWKVLRPNEGFLNARQTITNTPAQLGSGVTLRRMLMIYHNSSGNVYIGTASVSTSLGFLLPKNVLHQLPLGENITVFGFADTSTDVSVMEVW